MDPIHFPATLLFTHGRNQVCGLVCHFGRTGFGMSKRTFGRKSASSHERLKKGKVRRQITDSLRSCDRRVADQNGSRRATFSQRSTLCVRRDGHRQPSDEWRLRHVIFLAFLCGRSCSWPSSSSIGKRAPPRFPPPCCLDLHYRGNYFEPSRADRESRRNHYVWEVCTQANTL